jgi:hypothetical protein
MNFKSCQPIALTTACLGIIASALSGAVTITEDTDEGAACFRIATPAATYLYQKDAGGFSSMVDRDGIDWIGFSPRAQDSYPESAASSYRGLPNLVFRSPDSGAGHPGFARCVSIQAGADTIRTFSRSGMWRWSWQFTEQEATLTVEAVDPGHCYWFLYEGPIAGAFEPAVQYWGNDRDGPIRTFTDFFRKEGEFGQWSWVYFGSDRVDRVLWLRHLTPDRLPDVMGYLGNSPAGLDSPDGMVVFGFGRYAGASPQMSMVPNRFSIGFREGRVRSRADHDALAAAIAAAPPQQP